MSTGRRQSRWHAPAHAAKPLAAGLDGSLHPPGPARRPDWPEHLARTDLTALSARLREGLAAPRRQGPGNGPRISAAPGPPSSTPTSSTRAFRSRCTPGLLRLPRQEQQERLQRPHRILEVRVKHPPPPPPRRPPLSEHRITASQRPGIGEQMPDLTGGRAPGLACGPVTRPRGLPGRPPDMPGGDGLVPAVPATLLGSGS